MCLKAVSTVSLSVRFHCQYGFTLMHLSIHLSNYFDKKAEVFVKQLLNNLEILKANISVLHMKRKKAKEEKDKSNQRTLFSSFEEKMETPMESATSFESSPSDSDCL